MNSGTVIDISPRKAVISWNVTVPSGKGKKKKMSIRLPRTVNNTITSLYEMTSIRVQSYVSRVPLQPPESECEWRTLPAIRK